MPLTIQVLLSVVLALGMTAIPFAWYRLRKEKGPFQMDPQGQPGAFLPIMKTYLKLADGLWLLAIITLGYIASPIILQEIVPYDTQHLGSLTLLNAWAPFVAAFLCVLFFKVFLVIWYEAYRHADRSYTVSRYTAIRSLPIAAFLNLCLGYGTIVWDVALWIHNGGGNPPRSY